MPLWYGILGATYEVKSGVAARGAIRAGLELGRVDRVVLVGAG